MIEVTVSGLREQLAELLGRVQFGEEVVHINRHGKPVAVIISAKEFDFLEYCEGLHWAKEVEKMQADPDYDPSDVVSARDLFATMRAEEMADVAAVQEAIKLLLWGFYILEQPQLLIEHL